MQDLPPTTVNKSAEGRPVVPSQGGMMDRLEPYLTTNHCFHRYFPPEERRGYPRSDAATYWICQNYPKVCILQLKVMVYLDCQCISHPVK